MRAVESRCWVERLDVSRPGPRLDERDCGRPVRFFVSGLSAVIPTCWYHLSELIELFPAMVLHVTKLDAPAAGSEVGDVENSHAEDAQHG